MRIRRKCWHNSRERKQWLWQRGLISCTFCPYHRKENAGRVPYTDSYKNINRQSIRFMEVLEG